MFWINSKLFREYLSDKEEGTTEVPPTVLLQKFEKVAQSLVTYNICIAQSTENHSNVIVQIKWQGNDVIFVPKKNIGNFQENSVRFPHYRPLYDVIEAFSSRNLPSDFWLNESHFTIR